MMPVVLSTTNGEKDAMLFLEKAWEVLGGLPADGLCAYVENMVDFELNKEYGRIIENMGKVDEETLARITEAVQVQVGVFDKYN